MRNLILCFLAFNFIACAKFADQEQANCPGCSEKSINAPIGDGNESSEVPEQNPGVDNSDLSNLDPQKIIPEQLLKDAKKFFLSNSSEIPNKNYLLIADFAQHSSRRRLYLVNVATGAVETHNVAHGTATDPNNDGWADQFSNIPESHMSSIGFMLTAETYYGVKGYSLRLDGLSSTNDMVRERGVVIHQADYVIDGVKAGRTWGCPAIDPEISVSFINKVRGGSLYYIGLSKGQAVQALTYSDYLQR
jgi:hypothetical protein